VIGEQVLAEIAMPVFGLASELSVPTLARAAGSASSGAFQCLGVAFPDPLLSLITLTGAAIPYLRRICEEGLVNLKDVENRAAPSVCL